MGPYVARRETRPQVTAMLRADSGTAYRGAYGKGQDGGTEVERRNSASGGAAQHLDTGLPPASPAQAPCMQKTYSGPFKGQTPNGLHRISTDYAGPYGSGTKLNELDQAAGEPTMVPSAVALLTALECRSCLRQASWCLSTNQASYGSASPHPALNDS
ncbi:hypothetical protein WJX84_010444 [Apatococcus fuscideae]|uniref:Uncharacterized protein n=1 Tax=Apatococcus fuscideae TaxID=2026836 RepID=A0AAW1SSP3_9CHLO